MPDNDNDEEVLYTHAIDDGLLGSATDKQGKALKHFNFFLKGYCAQTGITVVDAKDIPYQGFPLLDEKEFWDDVIGCFVTYLGKHARQACNPKRDLLAFNTADGFLSSTKMYFVNKFRNETPIPVFQKSNTTTLRNKLKGFYRERKRGEGQPTKTEEVSSTRQDREAMATACIWLGTPEFAEWWHLLNTSYHCSGRGSEVSLIKTDGVIPLEINELVYKYHTLAVNLQRQKSGPYQTLPIYIHRDGLFEDYFFSLIHLLVVNGCSHEYVLPRFSQAALRTKKSGDSDSDVSKQWSKLFDKIRNTFEVLADEINEELGSHSNRRGSNQAKVEDPLLSGYAPIYLSGLKSKSIHTIFDYIFGSTVLMRQAGKTLSRWVVKISETTMGGQPATFDDIDTDVETLKKFTDVLFEDDTNRRWHPKAREILVMTLLLRYDDFVNVLQTHPFARLVESHPGTDEDDRYTCSAVQDNLFISRINQALHRATDLDEFDLKFCSPFPTWCGEAWKAFLSRNAPALPIKTFRLYGGDPNGRGILMDTHNLVDHFNALASVAQANHMELLHQKHMLNDIRYAFNVESKITSTFIVDKIFNIEKSLRRLEESLVGEPPATVATPPSKGVIRFSVSSKSLPSSLTEATVAFIADEYQAGFELDKKSSNWGEIKKSCSNKFSTVKKSVKFLLSHAESYPLKPENSPYHDKTVIRAIAKKAEKRVREAVGFDDTETVSVYKLEKKLSLPVVKEYEKGLKLPSNTPINVHRFFNNN